MHYRIYSQVERTSLFTDVHSCGRIPYITVREIKKRYRDKSFVIIGEICSLANAPADGDWLCIGDGKVIPILPRGSLKKPFERVVGYTPVQENSYVAVIGGFLHWLLSLRCIVKCSIRRN
jgi:hypothetical protein